MLLPVLACFLLALVISRPYLHSSFPYTHDNENHLARFANYKVALKEGQLPPRFAPNLANHYGYPVFNYNYPLANILSVPFSFLKLNYEVIFKIQVVMSIWLGLIGAWVWLTALGFKTAAKWAAIINFGFAPYLINLLSIRGNIGELWAMMLLPWLMAGVEYFRTTQKLNRFTVAGICLVTMAFLLSHNISAVLGLVLVLGYAVWRLILQRSRFIQFIGLIIWSILSTLWFWLPALTEKSLVILDSTSVNQKVTDHFATLSQLFFAPLTFGYSFVGRVDNLSFAVGISSFMALILATVFFAKLLWIKFRRHKNFTELAGLGGVFVLGSWILIVLQTELARPLFTLLTPLNFLQFPWRLTLFLQVLLLPLTALIWSELGKYWRVIISALLIWQVLVSLRVQPVDYFHKNNVDYEAFVQTTSTNNENLPANYTYHPTEQWQPTPTALDSTTTFQVSRFNGTIHDYKVHVIQPTTIIEPTANFAGWETTANHQPITYVDSSEIGGRVAYKLEPGDYTVHSQFTQNTPARKIGNLTSFAAWIALAGWISYTAWQSRKRIFVTTQKLA
jgi:hypothetical protein